MFLIDCSKWLINVLHSVWWKSKQYPAFWKSLEPFTVGFNTLNLPTLWRFTKDMNILVRIQENPTRFLKLFMNRPHIFITLPCKFRLIQIYWIRTSVFSNQCYCCTFLVFPFVMVNFTYQLIPRYVVKHYSECSCENVFG